MRSPSPDLLTLGRGIVRWAPIVNGVRKPWLDMGNVEQFTIATADTKLTKKSSRVAANVIYKEITSEREITVTMQGDEFDTDVMAALLQGTISTVDGHAGGVVAAGAEVHDAPGELDVIIQTEFPLISAVVIKQGATTFTNIATGGDDYEIVDAARGLIRLISAADGGDMNPAATFTVDYTYAALADAKRIDGGTETVVEASIHFAADNAQGPNRDGFFYRASLTADGELGFIGTEFGTWTLKAKLLDDSAGTFGGSSTCPLYELADKPSAT